MAVLLGRYQWPQNVVQVVEITSEAVTQPAEVKWSSCAQAMTRSLSKALNFRRQGML